VQNNLLKFCFIALMKFGTFLAAKNVSTSRISLRLSKGKDRKYYGNSKRVGRIFKVSDE